ncbi:MAG TPA: diadenylate cyclase CdaA [Candidatus Monoglobus merdigallinarum]|uniref:Diadenylate cyclase n=1 Tax=Candidatus Monoglobus merdigallinarum TaxID=2838698 RepID=A0A9D1PR66_9FIRM|nr:diadenylate cyclase CdaA [Candidatus Monoglobus merdigallinarum]
MITNFINSAIDQISLLRLADAVDICIVAVLVYFVLKFIRDSRTARLLKGVIMIIIAVQIVYLFNLHVTSYILSKCAQIGVIALVVIFQPELRRALDQVGKTSLSGWISNETETDTKTMEMIIEVSHAAQAMSNTKTGALIVIEQGADIGPLISAGIKIDGEVSSELLINIFIPNTPLHDGAVIIRDNRITMAACVLPLSQNPHITTELGTRHRAGLGISEESNVAVVIVSEETGTISVAHKGLLTRDLTEDTVKSTLKELLISKADRKQPGRAFNIFGRRGH